MKKSLATLAVAAAALTAVPLVAGAQESDEPSTDPGVTDDTTVPRPDAPGRHGRHGHGLGSSETLTDLLGLTEEELRTALHGGQTLAEIAEERGVSVDAVVDALVADATERITDAVENERLTQEEADERLAELEARITEKVNSVLERRGFGQGFGGFHGVGDLTELLGLEPTELFEALRNGSTLAELAEANGVTVDDLRRAMMGSAEERLAEAVTDGRITQAEADEALAGVTERVEDIINGEIPVRGRGFGGHHGGERAGPDATAPAEEEVSLSA